MREIMFRRASKRGLQKNPPPNDTELIIRALGRYAVALDTRSPDAMRPSFAPEAQLELDGVGKMSLDDYIGLCRHTLPLLDHTHHQMGLPVIDFEPVSARSRCYFTAAHVRSSVSGASHFTVRGWYDDEWAKGRDGWQIRYRRGTAVCADGNPDVLRF